MAGFFASLFSRRTKARHPDLGLEWLKARYHIFRVLLADHERALAAMAEVDRLLYENEAGTLAVVLEELYETVLELADGVNRLTRGGHPELYPQLAQARAGLVEALARYSRAPRGMWIPLALVTPDMREQAGGKAQPLAGLLRAGIAVPDGFVIPRRSCRAYLRQARLEERLGAILYEAAGEGADLEALAKRARTMILASSPTGEFAAEMRKAWESLAQGGPLSISVRSSASGEDGREHSFAGQYATVLGVASPEAFIAAFKEVLAGAFSPRAMAYRLRAGLGRQSVDMAVLCQRMVDARTAGVLFTADPMGEGARMLLTAVPGLGELAVSGRAPADVYHPSRAIAGDEEGQMPCEIAVKTHRVVQDAAGGVRLEEVEDAEARRPLLAAHEVERLRLTALRIEALAGCIQDIEWSIDQNGMLWILQARPAHLAKARIDGTGFGSGILLDGGLGVSPGKAAGTVVPVRSGADLALAARMEEPVVAVLRQSLTDGGAFPPNLAGIVVDMGGSPLDPLACQAREHATPMITGLGTATASLQPGQWVLVDGDRGAVLAADPRLWQGAPKPLRLAVGAGALDAAATIRRLVMDPGACGIPVQQCEGLHCITAAMYEQAATALFTAGDAVAKGAASAARRLRDKAGGSLLVIDLGGGLAPGSIGSEIAPEAIVCEPLAALWQGLSGGQPAVPAAAQTLAADIGCALVTGDYLNLHMRTGAYAVMVDAVCGAGARDNSVRVRFQGGEQAAETGERRARFVEEVLAAEGFVASRQGGMVSAVLREGSPDTVRARATMLGRLLRADALTDAACADDAMRAAQAFLAAGSALKH